MESLRRKRIAGSRGIYCLRWRAGRKLDGNARSLRMKVRGHRLDLPKKRVKRVTCSKTSMVPAFPANLIRTLMAQAAATHNVLPRTISFKVTMQTLEAFQPMIERQPVHDNALRLQLYQNLLRAIASHRVANRPDRVEPRAKKKRRDHYAWLTTPRNEIKRQMAKRVTAN